MLTVLSETAFLVDPVEYKFCENIQVFQPETEKCVELFHTYRKKFNTAGNVWRTDAQASWRDDFGRHHIEKICNVFYVSKGNTLRKKMRHK